MVELMIVDERMLELKMIYPLTTDRVTLLEFTVLPVMVELITREFSRSVSVIVEFWSTSPLKVITRISVNDELSVRSDASTL